MTPSFTDCLVAPELFGQHLKGDPATWDAWRWYVLRVWDSPEEAASLVLTMTSSSAFVSTFGGT